MVRRRLPLGVSAQKTNGSTPPTPGDFLTQIFGNAGSKISTEVNRLLGTFNPKFVNTRTRLLMRLDPDISFGLAILRAPIINLQWSIEGKEPIIKAFVDSVMQRCYRQLATGGSNAIPFGHQVVEKVWGSEQRIVEVQNAVDGSGSETILPNAWVYRRFKAIDPRTTEILIDEEIDDWIGIEQSIFTSTNQRRRGGTIQVGRERAFLWSYRKEDVWGDLRGFPKLDEAYEPWWFSSATSLFANRYFERKADPPIKGRGRRTIKKGGKDIDGFKFLQDQVLAMKSGAAFILPNDRDKDNKEFVWDIEFMLGDQRGDMFQRRIDALAIQKLRALWIVDDAATSPDGGGSLARANQRADLLGDTLDCLICEWLEVVNNQIIPDLVRFNFGDERAKASQTRMVAAGLAKGQRDLLKELFMGLLNAETMLADGKSAKLSDRIDGAQIMEQLRIPAVSMEELKKALEARAARAPDFGGAPDQGGDEDGDINIDAETEAAAVEDLISRGVMADEDDNE